MKRFFQRFLPWGGIVIGVFLLARWMNDRHDAAPEAPIAGKRPEHAVQTRRADETSAPAVGDAARDGDPGSGTQRIADRLRVELATFKAAGAGEITVHDLAKLREFLMAANPADAAQAITDFLAAGEDASTRLPFVVGSGGALDSWPTLRVFLLDVLPSLDPAAALGVSRHVMDAMESPDEYALALRNLSWNDLDGDLNAEFRRRFERMIAEKSWLQKPSAGFLEALDAAVRIADAAAFTAMIRLYSGAAAGGNDTLARASFMALDRMAEIDPAILVNLDQDLAEIRALPPRQRDSLMSRLDISDPGQRQVFTGYLSEVADPSELDYFASLFPNGNHLQGGRLFSVPMQPVSIAGRLEADRRVLTELGNLDFSAHPEADKAVGIIRARLTAWIAEGDAAR